MSLRLCVAFTCVLAFVRAGLVADAGEVRVLGQRQTPEGELDGGRNVSRNDRAPESLWRLDPVGWREDGSALESRSSGFALADTAPAKAVELRAHVLPRSCGGESFGTVGIAAYVSARDFWCLSLVKGPDHFGAQRFVELGPMTDGQWPAYGLYRRVEDRKGETWEWGRTYDLSLRFTQDHVEGEVRNAETGALVYRTAFEPKGRPLLPSGAIPALRVTGNFKARVESGEKDVVADVADSSAIEGAAPASPPYSPVGPETGIRGTATGFFHVENIDGIDWAVDPLGRAIPITGIDHVKWEGFPCEKLGGRRAYRDHNLKAYPSTQAWADDTLGRLRAWGFDMLAAGCDLDTLGHRGMAHAISLAMSNPFTYADEEWWIAENKHAPCTAFPNVFHPDYGRACEWAAETLCASSRDDPWLVGWFIDNELAWWGRSADRATGLFDLVMQKPDSHSAKKALLEYVAGRPITREVKLGFLRLAAERYFAATTAAIRRADPNHMILGCRFAGFAGAHDVVWEVADEYCDVVSFNCYPWADIDRGIVLAEKGGRPIIDEFRRRHNLCRRPMLVTEWSFPALDTGRPCFHGAGQRFHTQPERTAATELFARTMLAEPYFIGYDYFMWLDQPALGLNHWFPEDSNYGLVQENGEPHRLITEMFARLHADVAELRIAPQCSQILIATNVHKSQMPIASERNRFFAEADEHLNLSFVNNAVGFRQESDGSWVLSNGLVRLSGRLGGAFMADEICFSKGKASSPSDSSASRPAGRFRALLMRNEGDKTLWTDTECVTDVSFERDDATGIVSATIRAEGFAGDTGTKAPASDAWGAEEAAPKPVTGEAVAVFAITARLSVAPGRPDVLAEIVSAENLSSATLHVERVFMRPYAAEAKPQQTESVPNLWKGPIESRWLLSDGRRFGISSRDDSLHSATLWIKEDGIQHPDVRFKDGPRFDIATGGIWIPSVPMGALLKCD